MPFDAYEVYCNHQRQRDQPCPTREWWDNACRQSRSAKVSDAQFDHDKEQLGDAQ